MEYLIVVAVVLFETARMVTANGDENVISKCLLWRSAPHKGDG